MLVFVELMAGAAAFTGVILNNKKTEKKEDDSDDLDASELSYPDDE